MDNQNSGKGWALGFGLLAGIAIGYYLNSNEGRAARRQARVQFDEYGNQINEYGQVISSRANEFVNDAKHRGSEVIDQVKTESQRIAEEAKNKIDASKDWATNVADDVESSFKRGVKKAKSSVKTAAEKASKA